MKASDLSCTACGGKVLGFAEDYDLGSASSEDFFMSPRYVELYGTCSGDHKLVIISSGGRVDSIRAVREAQQDR